MPCRLDVGPTRRRSVPVGSFAARRLFHGVARRRERHGGSVHAKRPLDWWACGFGAVLGAQRPHQRRCGSELSTRSGQAGWLGMAAGEDAYEPVAMDFLDPNDVEVGSITFGNGAAAT